METGLWLSFYILPKMMLLARSYPHLTGEPSEALSSGSNWSKVSQLLRQKAAVVSNSASLALQSLLCMADPPVPALSLLSLPLLAANSPSLASPAFGLWVLYLSSLPAPESL